MYPPAEQNVNGWTVIREPPRRHSAGRSEDSYSEDGGDSNDMDVDRRPEYHHQQQPQHQHLAPQQQHPQQQQQQHNEQWYRQVSRAADRSCQT
jgi:hypothetical protein